MMQVCRLSCVHSWSIPQQREILIDHVDNDIKSLEAIQRQAVRFICGEYGRRTSITPLLDQLDLDLLATRRLMTQCQWRNSYGLRVGKPAGTRAKGAPAGCPFTLVFQLELPFQKGAPFQHFFQFGCEIRITLHSINN